MNAPDEPRCPSCSTLLVHAGAICVICDDQSHYEAPIRSSPPLSRRPQPNEPAAKS